MVNLGDLRKEATLKVNMFKGELSGFPFSSVKWAKCTVTSETLLLLWAEVLSQVTMNCFSNHVCSLLSPRVTCWQFLVLSFSQKKPLIFSNQCSSIVTYKCFCL